MALGVLLSPADIGRIGRLVSMRGDIAADAGVLVLEPRPTDVGVLVEDGEVDAGDFDGEEDAGVDAAEAGAYYCDLGLMVRYQYARCVFDGGIYLPSRV